MDKITLSSRQSQIVENATQLAEVVSLLTISYFNRQETRKRLDGLEKEIKQYDRLQDSLIQKLSPMRNVGR